MRNNPKYGTKLEYSEIFAKYTKVEKIRRFFSQKRQKLYKHFMMQPYNKEFNKENIAKFIQSVDDLLKIEGKLVAHYKVEQQYGQLEKNETIAFEQFFGNLLNWAVSQEKLTYEDIAKHEEELAREEEIEAFKKLTDRIL